GSLSGTLAEAAGDQLQWTIPMDFCAQLPNATSGTVQISCSTYNGSEYIGNAVIEVTLTVLPTVVPSAEETLSPVNENAWINSKGIYAAGFSRVKIDTAAAGVYGSTIKRIDISGDVTSYNAASSAVSDVLSSGTKTVTATVTDSRGRTKSDTKSITVQPYTKPIISSISYQRGTYTDGAWTDNDIGEDVKITFTLGLSLTAYGNRASISVAVGGETTQTSADAAAGSHTYYFTTIGTDVTRPLVVSATDSTGTTGSQSADIPTINVAANYNSSLKSIRIGGVAEDAESFRVSWPAIFDVAMTILGSEMTDFVVGSGTDGIWNYIKLLNGLAVCWGGYTFTGLPIDNAWGSLYISTPVKYDYPAGLFASAPEYFLNVSDCNGAYTSIGQANNSGIDLKTGTRDFFVTRTDAATIGSIRICCLAIGRWKI
ncbi:MAG: DUF859 family phage minor structural protein, partial [Oscillibacter sp.]|nr:DUF859 family phage minor structural protein [Oscillibacter sp.]